MSSNFQKKLKPRNLVCSDFFLFHKYTVASYPDPAKILYYLKNYIFICLVGSAKQTFDYRSSKYRKILCLRETLFVKFCETLKNS